jgi:hypothetical protein
MTDYETRTTRIVVAPAGKDLLDDLATTIEIEHEGAGEYIKVSQFREESTQTIAIDPSEWPHLREAIDRLHGDLRK